MRKVTFFLTSLLLTVCLFTSTANTIVRNGESTEKVKPTFRLKVNNGEIVVLPFFFCLS